MKRERLVAGTLGVLAVTVAITAVVYGCSDDTPDTKADDPDSGFTPELDSGTEPDTSEPDSAAQVFKAYATITSTTLAGAVAAGQATFTEQNGEVTVVVEGTHLRARTAFRNQNRTITGKNS